MPAIQTTAAAAVKMSDKTGSDICSNITSAIADQSPVGSLVILSGVEAQRQTLGSARVSRVGFGVSPKQASRKVRDSETPSPSRETRALPMTKKENAATLSQ